jgi:DNA mismatch endonuclease Vsr
MKKKWTKEEISILRKLYEEEGLGWLEASAILGRTKISVQVCGKRNKFRHSEEQERRLRSRIHEGEGNGMWGKIGPNLGLTKENSDRIRKAAEASSKKKIDMFKTGELEKPIGSKNGMWGKTGWRLGLTKENSEKVRKAGIKCSISHKEQWRILPFEEKERRRKLWASQALKCRKKRTSIELIVDEWLNDLGVVFQTQVQMGRWIPDFYIPSKKVVIECDGDYWHCSPHRYDRSLANEVQRKNMDRDARKDVFLCGNGIRVIRLWENEIRSGRAKQRLEDELKGDSSERKKDCVGGC